MSNVTENQERIGFLKGKAAQASGNYYARLGRHEIAKEEYQLALAAYNSVYQTLPDFAEAQQNKKTVLEILSELFGHLLVLGKWFQNEFDKATEAGWLTLDEVFGTAIPAISRKMAVKRAKQIDLGTEKLALVMDIKELTQEISIILRIYPLGEKNHLPDNLKFTVIPKSGEPHEYLAKSHPPAFETEWFFKRGEPFEVKIQLNGVTVTENFVI
jgi:hypothetical protein